MFERGKRERGYPLPVLFERGKRREKKREFGRERNGKARAIRDNKEEEHRTDRERNLLLTRN